MSTHYYNLIITSPQMDHTITQYVLNPRGEAVGFFLTNRLIDERVEIMERLMNEYETQFVRI